MPTTQHSVHISEFDAHFNVHQKATFYKNQVRVWYPAAQYPKLIPGMEVDKTHIRPRAIRGQSSQQAQNAARSLRLSKQTVTGIIKSNLFTEWATFTMKDQSLDAQSSRKKMQNWLQLQQKRKGKFEYLLVPEHHKSGKLHFHVMIQNYPGELKAAINLKESSKHYGEKLVVRGRQVYSIPSYRLGHNSVVKMGTTPEDQAKVGNYLTKYITKEFAESGNHEFEKKRYWASRGLKRPEVAYNLPNAGWGEPESLHKLEQGTLATYQRTEFIDSLKTTIPSYLLFDPSHKQRKLL